MSEGGGEEQTTVAQSGTPEVFISYASQDSAVAESVCSALEHAGIRCWLAPRDVAPGAFYGDAIVHAIDATRAIVLILSKHSADSPHVLREVERASSKRHLVVSLRTDHAPLPAGLEYFLNTSQWLDASEGQTDRAIPKLVAALRLPLEKPATPNAEIAAAPTAGGSSRASQPRRTGSPRRIAIVLVSLVAVAIGGFAAYRAWVTGRVITPPVAAGATAIQVNERVASVAPDHSVAVLPFADMSEKHDQEYFADGIAE